LVQGNIKPGRFADTIIVGVNPELEWPSGAYLQCLEQAAIVAQRDIESLQQRSQEQGAVAFNG
jgi:hypothetical protein